MSKSYEEIKRNRTRDEIIDRFEAYQRGEPYSMDDLLKVVVKFAQLETKHVEHDLQHGGCQADYDDWSQEVALKVWQHLDTFEGNGSKFYSWLHKICFNHAADAFKQVRKLKKERVPLTKMNDEGEEIENPDARNAAKGYIDLITPDESRHPLHPDEISDIIQAGRRNGIKPGDDLAVATLKTLGATHAQIAAAMGNGTTVKSVERRLARIRQRRVKKIAAKKGRIAAK